MMVYIFWFKVVILTGSCSSRCNQAKAPSEEPALSGVGCSTVGSDLCGFHNASTPYHIAPTTTRQLVEAGVSGGAIGRYYGARIRVTGKRKSVATADLFHALFASWSSLLRCDQKGKGG